MFVITGGKYLVLPRKPSRFRSTILPTLTNLFVISSGAIVTKGAEGLLERGQSRGPWIRGVVVVDSPVLKASWCSGNLDKSEALNRDPEIEQARPFGRFAPHLGLHYFESAVLSREARAAGLCR